MSQTYESSSSASTTHQETLSTSPIKVESKISESKFPVYKIFWPQANQHYAMKVFRQDSKSGSMAYKNEKRFSVLNHKNLIKIVSCVDEQPTKCGEKNWVTSLSIMELAKMDFTDLTNAAKLYQDEKLVRTFFRQLVSGVEYLHINGISHLDLKLDNLLLGHDYNLKISDFDVSFFERDSKIRSLGTLNSRAPEIKSKTCVQPMKADIFSLGVIVFCMMAGYHPFQEEEEILGHNLFDLLLNNPQEFMKIHESVDGLVKNWSQDFKDLVMNTMKKNPEERPEIQDLKKYKWVQGPVYSDEELRTLMIKLRQ